MISRLMRNEVAHEYGATVRLRTTSDYYDAAMDDVNHREASAEVSITME